MSGQEFYVGALLVAPRGTEGRSGRVSSVKAGATRGVEGRDQGGIDGKVRATPRWEAGNDDIAVAVMDPIDR